MEIEYIEFVDICKADWDFKPKSLSKHQVLYLTRVKVTAEVRSSRKWITMPIIKFSEKMWGLFLG